MNKERFQAAMNYVGDDLIAEAADYKPEAVRSKPGFFIKYGGAFACAAAVLAGVIGLKLWSDIKFGNVSLKNQSDPNDVISAAINQMNPASDGDSSPGIRFSPVYGKGDPTLDEWRGFDTVIWNTGKETDNSGLKSNGSDGDDLKSHDVKLGSVKISGKLQKALAANTDPYYSTFAVSVSFESCRDENELDAWKYKGMTVWLIKNRLRLEEVQPDNEEKVMELTKLLNDAYYDYYLVKMQQFYDTFKSRNLEIYPVEQGSFDDYSWFYCFIPAEMLNTFTCKPDEAFVFDLADR